MGTLIMMKSKTEPKHYKEFSRVVRTKGNKAGRRFLSTLRMPRNDWSQLIDYCYSHNGSACSLFR